MIYLDYAATTPMSDTALNAYVKSARQYFGNANSMHDLGGEAEQVVQFCKKQLGEFIGAQSDNIHLTSGGSMGNWLGIEHLKQQAEGNHVILSAGEHNSIRQTEAAFRQVGYQVSVIPFNSNGVIDLERLNEVLNEQTAIVCVQHSNGEIGTLQPIEQISKLCAEYQALLHVDAVQSFGKVDLSNIADLVDSLSVSSHKVYGPKGVGFLYLKDHPKYDSASMAQKWLRGNTVDVPSVVAMTSACEEAVERIEEEHHNQSQLRALFKESLIEPNVIQFFEGEKSIQLPSIIGMAIEHMEGQYVMLECNRHNIAISTGSACDVRYQQSANAMNALQMGEETARQFFRISFGRYTTYDEVKQLAACLNTLIETNVLNEVNSDGQPTIVER
ncbi:IscS subfamily cysteine desulfurase [Alkalibacillus salilacus]|uniref:Cysteine desulfurase n=1 Tax=Alkalibacillus salilacus TaxID=284582 RepID=A0ABT9VF93_9BACI|nr:IscS subfamily cysteine desulfurase [Alkalibacillus salilacus]MDQ0159572.1 cysteine desulfurase [Alkalibacillus salilacus]